MKNRHGTLVAVLLLITASPVQAADCNGNGIEDDLDIAPLEIGFPSSVHYPTGRLPLSVVAGDFNQDGLLDLVTANSGSDDVSLLLGQGAGVFAAPVNFDAGSRPLSLGAADLDADGDLDLAVVNSPRRSMTVLLNQGEGAFFATAELSTGDNQTSFVMADLDGDGAPDLAVTSWGPWNGSDHGPGEVSVFLNQGDGSFGPKRSFEIGGRPGSLAAGDLDGDGDRDLALTREGKKAYFLFNDGRGGFDRARELDEGYTLLTLADLDGDGRLDLAAAGGGSLWVLRNAGAGEFAVVAKRPLFFPPLRSITSVDLDRDGDLDLATSNALGGVSVLLIQGGRVQSAFHYLAGKGPGSLAAGDLDGDGDLDLAVSSLYTNEVSLLLNIGNGRLQAAVGSLGFLAGAIPLMRGGDFDGDGDVDLLAADGYRILLALNDRAGDFTERRYSTGGFRGYDLVLANGDLDGDGDLDLVLAGIGSTRVHVRRNVDGHFLTPVEYRPGDDDRVASLSLADLDGDRDLDLAAPVERGKLAVFSNNGDGRFGAARKLDLGARPTSCTTADLDGDGNIDVATVHRWSNLIQVLFNDGTGSFPFPAMSATIREPFQVLTADFDGDQDLDLVTSNDSDVTLLLNTGHRTFAAPVTIRGGATGVLVAADLDGERRPGSRFKSRL